MVYLAPLFLLPGVLIIFFVRRLILWLARNMHLEATAISSLSSPWWKLLLWRLRMIGILCIVSSLFFFIVALIPELLERVPSYVIYIPLVLPIIVGWILTRLVLIQWRKQSASNELDKMWKLAWKSDIVECDGKEITTIEGLGDPIREKLHPLQQAFIDHDGMQCGFCTPGAIMQAKALLDRNPNPTEQQVKEGLSGNLCRCGSYQKIVESVLAAALAMRGDWKAWQNDCRL